jgi:hypothetical protein
MNTFAKEAKATQQNVSAKSITLGRGHSGYSHEMKTILHFQSTIGNQAVQRLSQRHAEECDTVLTGTTSPRFGRDFSRIPVTTGPLHTKLAIYKPDDEYEKEADRVAEKIMLMQVPAAGFDRTTGPQIQRLCPECENELKHQPLVEEEEQRFQARSDSHVTSVDPNVENSIHTLSSRGQPLSESVRSYMGPRFNTDFGDVRIHTDGCAHDLARSLNAQALTIGRDIIFGAENYDHGSEEGRRLLAHELTHVIQQRHGLHNLAANFIQRKVDRCCRNVETGTEMDRLARLLGLRHCWLKTDTKVAGMGPAQGGPLPSWPLGIPTVVRDHSSEASTGCLEVPNVNENCVNQQLEIGKSTGPWGPDNNCNTFVDEVVGTCRRHSASSNGFSGQFEITARLPKSRSFSVPHDFVEVTSYAYWIGPGEWCRRGEYYMVLNEERWYGDREIGSRLFLQGRSETKAWTGLSRGTYYLEIWVPNTNPNCLLHGDIEVRA